MKLPSIRCTCPDCGTVHLCAHDEKKVAGWVARYIKGETQKEIARKLGYRHPGPVMLRIDQFLADHTKLTKRPTGILYRKECLTWALATYKGSLK